VILVARHRARVGQRNGRIACGSIRDSGIEIVRHESTPFSATPDATRAGGTGSVGSPRGSGRKRCGSWRVATRRVSFLVRAVCLAACPALLKKAPQIPLWLDLF